MATIELGVTKKHGKVHPGGEFGALKFSNDEESVLFVAEKLNKQQNFYDGDIEWNDPEKFYKANVGEKFALQESWGEQMFEVSLECFLFTYFLNLGEIPFDLYLEMEN